MRLSRFRVKVLRESKPVVPSDYEAETGVRWRAVFTDVPDDGNCLMHAVWKASPTFFRSLRPLCT